MGLIKNIVASIRQKTTDFQQRRAESRKRRQLAKVWEGMSERERTDAAALAVAKAKEQERMYARRLVRLQLMAKARAEYLQGERVQHLAGGVFWWPALAPLTQGERAEVRRGLGLPTRALKTGEVEHTSHEGAGIVRAG